MYIYFEIISLIEINYNNEIKIIKMLEISMKSLGKKISLKNKCGNANLLIEDVEISMHFIIIPDETIHRK